MRTVNSLILLLILVVSCNTNNKMKPAVFKKYAEYIVDSDIKEELLSPGLFSSTVGSDAIIDQLRSGEYLVIKWNQTGCFYYESRSMVFVKIDSAIYCILPGDLIMKLNPGQVDVIRNIETSLYHEDQAIDRNVPFNLNNIVFPSTKMGSTYSFCLGKRKRTYPEVSQGNYGGPFLSIMTSILLLGTPIQK